MTITTNPPVQQTFLLSPTPTKTTFSIDPPTFPPFPSFQTFLFDPTPSPSPTRTRAESPVLPPSSNDRRMSIPRSTLPAYPTPRSFYDDSRGSLHLSAHHSSSSSDLSIAQTAVEDGSAPRNTQLSDILPDDMDLYAGDDEDSEDGRPNARRRSVAPADITRDTFIEPDVDVEQVEVLQQIEPRPIRDENVDDLELGPEVQGTLRPIKEHDHPYHVPSSHLPPPRRETENEREARKSSRRLVKKNRGDGSGAGLRIVCKKLFRKVKNLRKL